MLPQARRGHGGRLKGALREQIGRASGSLIALMLICAPSPAAPMASPREGALCTDAIRNAERRHGLPSGLLMAVALTETGRRLDGVLTPWPWSINADGDGVWLESRRSALEHVRSLRERGVRSIDVGCMQVNLMWHDGAFADLDVAFDPAANVDYAARHIKSLRAQSGDWLEAAGRYHSWNQGRAEAYLERVLVNWRAVRTGAQPRLVVLPSAAGGVDMTFELAPAATEGDAPWLLTERGSSPLLEGARGPLVDLTPAQAVPGGGSWSTVPPCPSPCAPSTAPPSWSHSRSWR